MSINFELKKSISYANGSGAQIECSFITLEEPTGRVSNTCCAIEGLIQSGIMKMADMMDDDVVEEAKAAASAAKESEDPEEGKDGDAMLAIMVGSGIDMSKLILHFRELFKEVALMGGEKKLTSARMDDMSHKDFRGMVGVYAANFILG